MPGILQDLRYAARVLFGSAGFTVVAAVTLALGIGANTAMFSIIRGILLMPLPYAEPDRLARVYEESLPGVPEFPVSPGNFTDYRRDTQAFDGLSAYGRGDLQLGGDRPEQLRGMRITSGFFALLGYKPALGREFTTADEVDGAPNVVVLSHTLWLRRFNADRSILGRTVELSGRPFVVVGVLPSGVQHVGGTYRTYPHGDTVDVWWPQTLPSMPRRLDRVQHYLNVVGRIRPGLTETQARDDLRRISASLAARFPDSNDRWSVHLRSLRTDIVGPSETTLSALLLAAAAVLLIACLNVAGLLLGRATARLREIGVRAALGATRGRLVRQLLTESLLLAVIGLALGIALAYGAVLALRSYAPVETPRLQMVVVDRVVLGYTVIVSTLTALLFGLAPAIQLARGTNTALQGGRGAPGGAQQRLRRTLVVSELALAFVLVVTTGLLVRSFASLIRVEPGFRPDHVLTAKISLPSARYSRIAATTFFERLIANVGAVPGVLAVGLGSDLPWTGYDENTGFDIVGRQFAPHEGPEARYHFLTPGFVTALGVPLVAGRDVAPRDGETDTPVVMINEATARRYWGSARQAIGAQLRLWSDKPTTVVGVIGDVRDVPWAEGLPGGVYFPQAQQGSLEMFLAVRTETDPAGSVASIRRAVRELDPELPLTDVRPLDAVAGAVLSTRRFTLTLVAAFGVTALFLAIVGVYGVMAQAVAQRGREFGVRQALGARPADILRLVLGSGGAIGIAGLIGGLLLTLPITRLARSLLYQTSATDAATLASVAVLLLTVTLLASFIPARRATRHDPADALRQE